MTNEDEKSVLAGCMVILGAPVFLGGIMAVGFIIQGWVLVRLWGWFILPSFAGAPALTIPVAIGLTAIASLVQHYHRSAEDKDEEPWKKWGRLFGLMVFKPAFYLAIGYVASRFV